MLYGSERSTPIEDRRHGYWGKTDFLEFLSGTSSEPLTPRAAIEARTRGAIEVALLSHARGVHVGAGAKRLAAQATTEYHDRFLIELIQNAHDAHDAAETAGEIEILFARDEDEFGVLYVANRGNSFSHSNFGTICEIGLSDKLPGEAIGNKGIGFKSVLQICSRPEIYSGHPDTQGAQRSGFDGFCFSFARDDDLLRLVNGDREEFAVVRRETAPFHLPVPLDREPDSVRAFARSGFATAIRLPLDREGAVEDVEAQLEALQTGDAPLLLFLRRLRRLCIETKGGVSPYRVELHRVGQDLSWPEAEGVDVALVNLHEQGRYLCASVTVAAKEVEAVVASAVENHELEETWLEWHDDAVISAAVRLDAPTQEGRLYTHLPMEVQAPFVGHLNAPFYARLDRRDLNRDLSLNSLFLDAGARACRLAAEAITQRDDRALAGAAVDLFAWEAAESTRLEHALGDEKPASEAAVLPVVAGGSLGWGSISLSYIWRDEGRRTLTTKAITQSSDVQILDPSLQSDRVERVEGLRWALLNRGMEPKPAEVAEWVEGLARARESSVESISWWNSFYTELAEAFEHDAEHLEGRRILLDEEGKLRAAGSSGDAKDSGPTVFFQPVRERAEGIVDIDATDVVRIPKTLRRRMVFLHPRLEWLERAGRARRRKKSRVFLEEHDLVRPYAARSLLENLRGVLERSRSKDVYRDALRLAFRLQRTRDYDQRPALRDLGLRVPVQGGWITATDAHFSDSWSGTMGGALERLIDLAGGVSEELVAVRSTLLVPPEEWPFAADPSEWIVFLDQAGVRDGIWPITGKRSRGQERGWTFTAEAVGKQVGLPKPVLTMWADAVAESGTGPEFPNGLYRNSTPFYHLPGQGDYAQFSQYARNEYAELVATSCGRWADEHLSVETRRTDVYSRNVDPFSWPTPVCAFLRRQAWVPMTTPQARETLTFVSLPDAWHFADTFANSSDYAQPDFASILPLRLRRALDAKPASLDLLRTLGLNVWNDPEHASILVEHLGQLVCSDGVSDQHVPQVRRAYEQAWAYALGAGAGSDAASSRYLLVTRSGRLEAFDPSSQPAETLYVHDGASHLADSLLALSSRPLLDVGSGVGAEVKNLLIERLGERVLLTSDEQVLVVDEGKPLVPDGTGDLLLSGGLAWLDGLVMATLEFRRGAFRRLTGTVRERIVQTLRTTRLRFANEILLQIGSETLAPPRGMRDAVPLRDEDFPTVVVRGNPASVTWEVLDSLLPALADLIGYAELAPAMQLAVTRLSRGNPEYPVTQPLVAEVAEALDQPIEQIQTVMRGLRGSAAGLLDVLAPIVVFSAGFDDYERLAAQVDDLESEDEVLSLLRDLELGAPPEELVTIARGATSPDDLRRALGFSLLEFNQALRALGRAPIHYVDEHAQTFAAFLAEHREPTLLHLRRAYLSAYREEALLDRYVAVRDSLPALEPDPSWLEEYDLPPTEGMENRLHGWLDAEVNHLTLSSVRLKPFDDIRRLNKAQVRALIQRAQRTILAWSARQQRDTPSPWDGPDPDIPLWDALLEAGECDFEPIDTERCLRWLQRTGHWPGGMALTLDLAKLGLREEALENAQTAEEEERARRDFLRRSIEIEGTRYSAAPEDFAALAEAVRGTVTQALLHTKTGYTTLQKPTTRRPPGDRTKRTTIAANRGATESQRAAIGLVGEVVALEWLKKRYSGASDDCWKSGYRNFVLGGALGDDSLGFDFEVPSGRTSYYFEVKATSGDETQIELGETEVLAARQHAHTERYRILYIPFALDAKRRSVHVLPNPLGEQGRDLFELAGSGLRYRFRLNA